MSSFFFNIHIFWSLTLIGREMFMQFLGKKTSVAVHEPIFGKVGSPNISLVPQNGGFILTDINCMDTAYGYGKTHPPK